MTTPQLRRTALLVLCACGLVSGCRSTTNSLSMSAERGVIPAAPTATGPSGDDDQSAALSALASSSEKVNEALSSPREYSPEEYSAAEAVRAQSTTRGGSYTSGCTKGCCAN